ncbi:MAG: PDZ domain-containing protein [Planctomycetota bacterium]
MSRPARHRNCLGITAFTLGALLGCVQWAPSERVPESFATRLYEPLPQGPEQEDSFIGLRVEAHQSDTLDALEFFPGVRVVDVVENSPAARAGLRADDVILSLNGFPTNDREGFEALVAALRPGEDAHLEVQRAAEVFRQTVRVVGRLHRGAPPEPLYHVERIKARVKVRTTAVASGALRRGAAEVVELLPGSPLAEAGLRPGDLLLAIDGRPVESAPDFVARTHERRPGEKVLLEYQQAGRVVSETIELWQPREVLKQLRIPLLFTYESDPQHDVEAVEVKILDLYIFSLFSYERDGRESTYTFLSLFALSSGSGELTELAPESRVSR